MLTDLPVCSHPTQTQKPYNRMDSSEMQSKTSCVWYHRLLKDQKNIHLHRTRAYLSRYHHSGIAFYKTEVSLFNHRHSCMQRHFLERMFFLRKKQALFGEPILNHFRQRNKRLKDKPDSTIV